LGFANSGLSHGVTTNGPANDWKFHLPFPANHSCISSGRNSVGNLSWIGDISAEAAVAILV
jgi:hypothetical protein